MEMPVAQVRDQAEAMESQAAVAVREVLVELVRLPQEPVELLVTEQVTSLIGV
jgi:hypothetical protein